MQHHSELSDLAFEQQFADGILPPTLFNHEAHLRLAWIHIKRYGIDVAIQNVTVQLQSYVSGLGASDKYNHTLTIAAIRAVYHFILKSQTTDFQSFIEENPRLKFNFKDLMFAHYRTNIFIAEYAKTQYLEPELLPFD